ncbi:hypothetical protein NB688_002130 [Xanthomonas sacchari]|uniref:Uncharacterized protein n=1 Tax=Xanthomonas sacchari TaxID=56458 RepID=A0ABT3E034_9XANT|nr:hypothetical protein [Xanthomonas sacchari]MCW0405745.1 hypothetical protein [Xanthomonas sacchari]MCW0414461.1 hypothetical protein [Xanthomonas sacchari]MCW0419964.1 hypothetical protein [Xanthomonas sacchari]
MSLRAIGPHSVEAELAGSEIHNVRLERRGGALHGECDSPIRAQEASCKPIERGHAPQHGTSTSP